MEEASREAAELREAMEAMQERLREQGEMTWQDRQAMEKLMARTKREMEKADKELAFMDAARLRDELFALQEAVKDWPA